MENCGVKTVWFLILVFLALGIGSFCASCYIFLHPISVCIPGLEPFLILLMKGIHFPHYCAERMMGVPLQNERDLPHPQVVSQQTNLDY